MPVQIEPSVLTVNLGSLHQQNLHSSPHLHDNSRQYCPDKTNLSGEAKLIVNHDSDNLENSDEMNSNVKDNNQIQEDLPAKNEDNASDSQVSLYFIYNYLSN